MASIPNGLGSVADLLRRFKAARENWELWRSLHQEAFDFANPQRQTFTQHSPGQRKNRHIYDFTAVLGLESFQSRIQGAVLPPWQEFVQFVAGDEIPEDEQDRTNKGLEDVTDTFFSNLNHSNFSTEISPSLSDLGIGTGAIQIEEGGFEDGEVFEFCNVPLSECFPEKPARGAIKNVWRQQEIEARSIKIVWPEAELPGDLESLAKNSPEQKVKILNGHLFNQEDKKYHQIVIYEPSKSVMFTQSFNTKRLIVFRWHVVPGETFGRGPILQMLPGIRSANKIVQFTLENAALQMAGVYTGVDDGVFNPHTVRIAPGSIIPVASNASTNPSLTPLARSGDLGLGNLVLEDIQNDIKKALFADPFGDFQDPTRTLGEQLLRKQEMLETRGASLGRLKSELIEPLAAAGIDILQSRGLIAPITVDGKQVTIKQTSPLAQAEDLNDFQNFQVWFGFNAQLPQEIVAATIKVEEIPRWTQKKLGIPAELVRSDAERKQIEDTIRQAAQATIKQGGESGGQPGGPVG